MFTLTTWHPEIYTQPTQRCWYKNIVIVLLHISEAFHVLFHFIYFLPLPFSVYSSVCLKMNGNRYKSGWRALEQYWKTSANLHLPKIMRHFGSDLLECNWSDVVIVNSTATRALIAIPVQCEIQKIGRNNTRACIINPRQESESEPCSTELIETDSLCSYILTSTEENFYCRGWRKKYGKNLMSMTNFEETIVIEFTVAELLQTQSIQNTGQLAVFSLLLIPLRLCKSSVMMP